MFILKGPVLVLNYVMLLGNPTSHTFYKPARVFVRAGQPQEIIHNCERRYLLPCGFLRGRYFLMETQFNTNINLHGINKFQECVKENLKCYYHI